MSHSFLVKDLIIACYENWFDVLHIMRIWAIFTRHDENFLWLNKLGALIF